MAGRDGRSTPETVLQEAALLANKLCALVRAHVFRATGQDLHVTTSIGVAQHHRDLARPPRWWKRLIALYRAKELGRNRVEIDGL